ncbi:Tfp pilus assembly protein PilO [Microbacteriaceae bacterium SG_E_30_P1]|uniref:Tfp pilus assembly protein PilO n=1 Tax=Antiquaquibacter oligotrophicus TaxID=2880260 RepID=A0ABT6KJE4_9MICO|nr:type 4a pilus biogenesis protein PilO [Antiquaquibacter oligotrophicus]MDH6179899.1 Tfp pilus assembly protein PilO [Antiquaquibacter oligotrophicus]UDF14341.1 type 4a pilus biogenesis protein PilO [Antiquaquibacter oligotrophicus]
MSARRIWIIAGSIAIAAILVLGWFAAVSPVLAQAGANDDDRAAVAEQNAGHEATLADLRNEYENIGQLRADLDGLVSALPPREAMPELIREVGNAATASGVALVAIKASDAVGFVPAVNAPADSAAAPAEATDSGTDSTAEGSDAATEEPAAATDPAVDPAGGVVAVDPGDLALLPPDRFIVIPVEIQVSGAQDQMIAMARALQSMNRTFVVTAFTIDSGEPPRATISGYAYVLTDDTGVLTPDTEEPSPTEAPAT